MRAKQLTYLGFLDRQKLSAIEKHGHYSPQSFAQILFAFALRDNFDRLLEKSVGKNYCTFFEARNGLYHILMYLKRRFRSRRIFVPDMICQAVRLASKRAGYGIVYYKGKPAGFKENDVLLTASAVKLPGKAFTIEDNARNPTIPSKDYDFSLYSFGNGKPLSSGGGGVVVVNNEKLHDFLDAAGLLRKPGLSVEIRAYLKSLFWRLTTSGSVRRYGKKALRSIDSSYGTGSGIKIVNLDLSMCSTSKRLASTIL